MTDQILHLSRPEKAILVAALCLTDYKPQPTMDMEITLQIANQALWLPGIIDLLKLCFDKSVLLSLLTLVDCINKRGQ